MMIFFKNGFFYLGLVLLTLFISLFSIKLISVFLIILFFYWIIVERDFSNSDKQKKWIWPYFFYVFIFIIGFMFSDDKVNTLKQLERLIPFILIPFLFVFIKWNRLKIMFFGNVFIFGVLFVCLLSIGFLLHFIVTHQEFLRGMDENYLQWKLPQLMGFHPTYFGLYIVVATIIILFENDLTLNKKNFFLKLSFVVFFTIYLFYLSTRNALLCQFIVIGYFILHYSRSVLKLKTLSIVLILLSFVSFLTIATYSSNYLTDKMGRIFSDDRLQLWPFALNRIKNNYYLFGEGLGNGSLMLKKSVLKINDTRVYYKGLDLHNQYLKNYLDLGVFGFSALMYLLLSPLYYIKDKSLFLFMLVFSIAIFTESMLSIIKGVIFFNFMSFYFIKKSLISKQ